LLGGGGGGSSSPLSSSSKKTRLIWMLETLLPNLHDP